jgi:hypothetical protein
MRAKMVRAADNRMWSVRRNIEWRMPATGHEFEHDVDGGRGAAVLILTALGLFWAVLLLWVPTQAHVPWYLRVAALVVVMFFPLRWALRRPWTIVAETSEGYGQDVEHWSGMVRGRGRAKEEMRVAVRSLETRATPGHADSPLHRIN